MSDERVVDMEIVHRNPTHPLDGVLGDMRDAINEVAASYRMSQFEKIGCLQILISHMSIQVDAEDDGE